MYNEFLFFYEKEPYKQFIWRYMGQTIRWAGNQIK